MTAKKLETEHKGKKLCFVIGPIGQEGTETRDKADWLLHFVKGAVEPLDYEVKRADEISEPGSITHQIINAIYEAELVIADLTGHNANAFYELAIRHSVQKPVIHMIEEGASIPFDIKDHRTIFYSPSNPRKMLVPMEKLVEQIEAISKPDFAVSNPISQALAIKKMEASPDKHGQMLVGIINRMDYLEDRLINKSYAEIMRREYASRDENSSAGGRGLFGMKNDSIRGALGLLGEALTDNQTVNNRNLGDLDKIARYNKMRKNRVEMIKALEAKTGKKHLLSFPSDKDT
ncbi:MAG: hypothetical protein HQL43_09910 [Alphaproteobacteria bacterium]|nr:hypothetical protein [Alphaproteobacteria bacterium]